MTKKAVCIVIFCRLYYCPFTSIATLLCTENEYGTSDVSRNVW